MHASYHYKDQFDGFTITDPYAVHSHQLSPFILFRLRKEKEFLENGLANCVTYLHVLRKKQTHNYRRLNQDPLPPRKKRKRYQQIDRELEKEIKQREQDEEAFLNNLQACKANIYMAEALLCTPNDLLSLEADCALTLTQCSYTESEPTEFSWSGWADEVTSPFEKQSQLPFFVDDNAPDAHADESTDMVVVLKDAKRPRPLSRITEESVVFIPAPLNTARSQFPTSILDPGAAVFEPKLAFDKLSNSPLSTVLRSTNAELPSRIQKDSTRECAKELHTRQQQSRKESMSMMRAPVGRERSNSV